MADIILGRGFVRRENERNPDAMFRCYMPYTKGKQATLDDFAKSFCQAAFLTAGASVPGNTPFLSAFCSAKSWVNFSSVYAF